MTSRRSVNGLVCALLSAIAATIVVQPAAASAQGGALVFTSYREGVAGVYTVNARTRTLAQRIGSTVRRLGPTSSRGRRVRRIVLRTIASIQAVAADLRAESRSLRRRNRRAAQAHARSALEKFLGIGFGLAEGQSIAGAPQGTV